MWQLALGILAIAVVRLIVRSRRIERRATAQRKFSVEGVIVGTEPIVLDRANARGVLLIHGAGDTPQVLRDLATFLFDRGYSVRVPLLSGHGRALSALSSVTADEWHDEVSR